MDVMVEIRGRLINSQNDREHMQRKIEVRRE